MKVNEYMDYVKVRDFAWEILLREGVHELPVKTAALCRQMGVDVKLSSTLDTGGKSTVIGDRALIVIKSDDIPERQRFSTMHELGHILLGHVGKYELVCREPSPNDNPIETAANRFAVRILAPACVLWGCGVENADEIAELCRISASAARFRMERLRELYARGKFLTSTLERRVYEQFQPYIEAHKIRDRPEHPGADRQ